MQEDDRQLVIQALGSLPAERFAVVDGAHFDDLPKELDVWQTGIQGALSGKTRRNTVHCRAISCQHCRIGRLQTGCFHWLLNYLLLCFGHGRMGNPACYKHLRRINMIEIPVDDYDPELAQSMTGCLFRHGRPECNDRYAYQYLDEGQFTQMLGGAAGLIMFARDEGGLTGGAAYL